MQSFSYQGNAVNQYTLIDSTVPTYDANGNITRLPTREPNAVNWNWDNKLAAAQKGTSSIAVKYDPMGNRVWRQSTVGGVTTGRKYIVDISGELPTILCELDVADPNLLTSSYIYADGQILSQRLYDNPEDPNDYTPYYYVHDRLGSVRLMIHSAGSAVCSYSYTPYGKFYDGEHVETIANPWKFTGQYYDAEIEQYYLRARQYDPAMMRFTSRDPDRGSYNEPMTLHRYLYCLNEPIDYVDPKGESIALDLTTGRAGLMLGVAGMAMYGLYAMNSGHVLGTDIVIDALERGYDNAVFNAALLCRSIKDLFYGLSGKGANPQDKIDGAMKQIKLHMDEINGSDPNNRNRKDWLKHIRKHLGNIKKLATKRLKGKAQEEALKNIDDVLNQLGDLPSQWDVPMDL